MVNFAPVSAIFDVVFRFEYNDYYGPSLIDGISEMTEYSTVFFSGVMFRVIPWQKAIVTPYAHVGLVYC